MKNKISRREVVKNGTLVIGGLSVLGLVACTKEKPGQASAPEATTAQVPKAVAGGGDPLISETHAMAKPLKYVHDGSKVDPALRKLKAGVEPKDQSCLNCNFYKPVEGQEYGACALLPVPGKHVAAKGWCITWSKKA